jgi:hypothetical protein
MPAVKDLSTPGTITIRGKVYPFQPVDGYGMQLIHSTPNEKVPMIRASYEVAARCLGLPFDEVFGTKDKPGFSEEEIMYVLGEAQKNVRSVEAAAPPNSEAAAERTDNNLSLAG